MEAPMIAVLAWILLAVALLAGELHTGALVALFLAIGAFGGAAAALLGAPPAVQVLVGIVAAVIGILQARPHLVRWSTRRQAAFVTPGVGNLVGQDAVTVDTVLV